jgi:hypothetical protein
MPTPELETSRTKRSRKDEVTYMKWRRGVLIYYTCVGLAARGKRPSRRQAQPFYELPPPHR